MTTTPTTPGLTDAHLPVVTDPADRSQEAGAAPTAAGDDASAAAPTRRARRVGSPGRILAWSVSVAAVTIFVVMAFLPGLFTSTDPDATDFSVGLTPPSADHVFGTDSLGRDLFARVVHGARLSLVVGVAATLLSVALGTIVGLIAGLSGGIVDRSITRVLDVLLAFPGILLALLVVVILGPGIGNLAIAIGIGSFPGAARLVRSQVIVVKRSGYVETATTLGRPRLHLVGRHILPNSISPLLVMATIGVGSAIIAASALSFIGLGAQPPQAEWGLLLSESRSLLQEAPWLSLMPGLVLVLAVLSITALGRLLQSRFEGRN